MAEWQDVTADSEYYPLLESDDEHIAYPCIKHNNITIAVLRTDRGLWQGYRLRKITVQRTDIYEGPREVFIVERQQ